MERTATVVRTQWRADARNLALMMTFISEHFKLENHSTYHAEHFSFVAPSGQHSSTRILTVGKVQVPKSDSVVVRS